MSERTGRDGRGRPTTIIGPSPSSRRRRGLKGSHFQPKASPAPEQTPPRASNSSIDWPAAEAHLLGHKDRILGELKASGFKFRFIKSRYPPEFLVRIGITESPSKHPSRRGQQIDASGCWLRLNDDDIRVIADLASVIAQDLKVKLVERGHHWLEYSLRPRFDQFPKAATHPQASSESNMTGVVSAVGPGLRSGTPGARSSFRARPPAAEKAR